MHGDLEPPSCSSIPHGVLVKGIRQPPGLFVRMMKHLETAVAPPPLEASRTDFVPPFPLQLNGGGEEDQPGYRMKRIPRVTRRRLHCHEPSEARPDQDDAAGRQRDELLIEPLQHS